MILTCSDWATGPTVKDGVLGWLGMHRKGVLLVKACVKLDISHGSYDEPIGVKISTYSRLPYFRSRCS